MESLSPSLLCLATQHLREREGEPELMRRQTEEEEGRSSDPTDGRIQMAHTFTVQSSGTKVVSILSLFFLLLCGQAWWGVRFAQPDAAWGVRFAWWGVRFAQRQVRKSDTPSQQR